MDKDRVPDIGDNISVLQAKTTFSSRWRRHQFLAIGYGQENTEAAKTWLSFTENGVAEWG
ncbi:hypothetical protein VE04_09955, partial [Pseudogymnoascus sp. 24MN13]